MMFPETIRGWRRFKLLLAELLVLSTAKGDHTFGYLDRASDAVVAIRQYREMYYPAPKAERQWQRQS